MTTTQEFSKAVYDTQDVFYNLANRRNRGEEGLDQAIADAEVAMKAASAANRAHKQAQGFKSTPSCHYCGMALNRSGECDDCGSEPF